MGRRASAPPEIDAAEHCGGRGYLRAVAGRESFDDFYRREFPRLLVVAGSLVGPAYAEDVVQEALLVAHLRWRHVAAMRSPVGYVQGICLHQAATVVRRRTLERRLLRRFEVATAPAGDGPAVDGSRLWSQVRALPRRQAQTVTLHYALDLSVAETAEILECAEGTVKVHLHRARIALALALGPGERES